MGSSPGVGRPPGRPRDARVDDLVLDAALELVGEHGISGTSVEAIAARAGVSKATIYRRWPNREQLVFAAVARLDDHVVPADTGSLLGDLQAIARQVSQKMADGHIGTVLPTMVSEASRNPEVRRLLAAFSAERRRPARDAIERAKVRGEIDPAVDTDLVVDITIGPIFSRYFLASGATDGPAVEELVDTALRAFVRDGPPNG